MWVLFDVGSSGMGSSAKVQLYWMGSNSDTLLEIG